jgi:flotillin
MCFDMGVVTCGPNEALIISGMFFGPEPSMIVGGRALVCPCIQRVQRIPLSTMTLVVQSPRVYTSQGVPISVTGVAQVKINGSNDEMLRAAAEQFGDKTEEEISAVAHETLEGHQRAIMGNMTVEEIYRDRKTFSGKVFEVASTDLLNMGVMVISYTLKDIHDDVGYLKALGQARTAEVQRDARIGEATAQMQSTMAEAKAEMERMESKLLNETEIARSKRDFDLKKASYDVEVNTARAEAELAYSLQAAIMQQKIKEQDMQVKVIERMQEIEIQQQEIQRKERELDSRIRKPAEAEKYKMEKIAEAQRLRTVLEAEAEAESIALKGEAEAFAIEAKAKAEAEQMAKKADAWGEYEKAALMDMILKVLPNLAAEVAAPLSKANKITMVSDGTSEVGASKLTGEILDIMARIPESVSLMTGFDMKKQMSQKF